jgi:hypothetical protein
MKVELHPYEYTKEGRHHSADFFPFVDGKPRPDLNHCSYCIFDNGTDECEKAKRITKSDDKLYLFCGNICGYFTLKAREGGCV